MVSVRLALEKFVFDIVDLMKIEPLRLALSKLTLVRLELIN